MWNSIIKPALILFIICGVIAGALAGVNAMTEVTIAEQKAKEEMIARKEVLAIADTFDKIEVEKMLVSEPDVQKVVNSVYLAKNNNEECGYVLSVTGYGYGGDIIITVGINSEGIIEKIKIGEHNETPGLGGNATNPQFTDQFMNKMKHIKVTKNAPMNDEIQAITGATITSRAVTDAVNKAVEAVKLIIGGTQQ